MTLQTAKDDALHMVGRTIANLQVMEHLVKALSRCVPVAGHLQEIQAELEKRQARSASLTLGGALSLWRQVLKDSSTEANPISDMFDTTMSVSIRFELESEALQQHLENIDLLLNERNRLVHSDIVAVDWTSDCEITSFTDRLGDVNRRTCAQIEFLRDLLGNVQSLGSALEAASESAEFESFFNEAPREADA